MKKIFMCLALMLAVSNCVMAKESKTIDTDKKEVCNQELCENDTLSQKELKNAEKIITKLQKKTEKQIEEGKGPFRAAIYDGKGRLIAEMPNSVVEDNCCLNHAEVNTIREAQKKLKTYDLAPYNASMYVSAEPCIMCAGAIMWSGVKNVYFSVKSEDVERITGFDEGYKPDWINQFKKRGINVYGDICSEQGKEVLQKYVDSGKTIYKSTRK